jgi:hypothetical protein
MMWTVVELLGEFACDALTDYGKRTLDNALGITGIAPRQKATSQSESDLFAKERTAFEQFFAENGDKPMAENKEAMRAFMNVCISKAYYQGGNDMQDGIESANR